MTTFQDLYKNIEDYTALNWKEKVKNDDKYLLYNIEFEGRKIFVKIFTPVYLSDIDVIELLVNESKLAYEKDLITFNETFGYNINDGLRVYTKVNKLAKKLEYLFGSSLFENFMTV